MKVVQARRFGYYRSLAMLLGLLWSSVGAGSPGGIPEAAAATSDPVIAAAGDIACDPGNRSFNAGKGTLRSCRQQYTANLLEGARLTAILALGDIQYYCSGYQAFLKSYDLSWGR